VFDGDVLKLKGELMAAYQKLDSAKDACFIPKVQSYQSFGEDTLIAKEND
jgi:hypothetical protein